MFQQRGDAKQRSGLRTTVRLYGTIVQQQVDWCPLVLGRRRWRRVGEMAPGSGVQGLALSLDPEGAIELEAVDESVQAHSGEMWTWEGPEGVSVAFDVIPMKRAQRAPRSRWDLALLVMMLTLMVGVAQLNFLFRAIVGERVASTEALTPPELLRNRRRTNSMVKRWVPWHMFSGPDTYAHRSRSICRRDRRAP